MLLLDVGGPQKKKLLANVAMSEALYGTTGWVSAETVTCRRVEMEFFA